MRTASRTSLLWLMILVVSGKACLAQDQKPPAFHITGTVINRVTHAPVPHCRLMTALSQDLQDAGPQNAGLRSVGPRNARPASSDGFEADASGHFDIPVASAGTWNLTARARGYVSQGLDEHEGFFTGVVLTPENPTLNVLFALTPNSSISGIVLDEANEPVRQAQIVLQAVPHETDDGQTTASRGQTMTDDRGHYELANLATGDYRVSVHAQPWYATAPQSVRIQSTATDPVSNDPALDVVYPVTWFPGVQDPATATTITLHGGDGAEADFHLLPIQSVHLHLAMPVAQPNLMPLTQDGQQSQVRTRNLNSVRFPQIMPVSSGGDAMGSIPSMVANTQGQIDAGGLAPGLYEVTWPGSEARNALVQVTANSSRSLDMNTVSAGVHVSLKIDGGIERVGGQVTFVDVDNPQIVFYAKDLMTPMRENQTGDNVQKRGPRPDPSVDLLPGRYRVFVSGNQGIYLTGVSAVGAETSGRMVTVHGDASLTLHVASGLRKVSGLVRYQGRPAIGVQVLLIPATFHEPDSLTTVRRDQSNSDGSYNLGQVIPGQYILIAIDGWQVNWNDPSTLRSYLLHGVPLDLGPGGDVRQEIEAQVP